MKRHSHCKRTALSGFTLVELLAVIVVMGLIAALGSSLLVNTIETYKIAEQRSQLIQRGRLTMEQMTREIRTAIPNSLRVSDSQSCLEFIPTAAVSRYSDQLATADNAAAKQDFLDVDDSTLSLASPKYVVIEPFSSAEIYSAHNPSVISPIANINIFRTQTSAITRIGLRAAHRFTRASKSQRFYIGEDPVRYCLIDGSLQRASAYGLDTATLSDKLPAGKVDLMAQNISSDGSVFSLSPVTEDRHGLVTIELNFANKKLSIALKNSVLIRNSPWI